MGLTIVNAYRPFYADPKGQSIGLDVRFREYPEIMGFLARADDPEPHGRDLYNAAKAGKYGPISPYAVSVEEQLQDAKRAATEKIDGIAESIRMTYITPGAGQTMVYQAKTEEAERFVTSTDSWPGHYPMLSASIGVEGATIAEVAARVRNARAEWIKVASVIEAARISGKAAVDAAASEEAINNALNAIVWPQKNGA